MTDQSSEIIDTKAVCSRLVAELGENYRFTPRRILQLVNRDRDPLPTVGPVAKGKPAWFDWDHVLEWFDAEVDRRAAGQQNTVVSLTDGIQLTVSAFARELGRHPQTVARIVNEWNVEPIARRATRGGETDFYRLRDLLDAITASTTDTDPDSLPATERDAYYRSEMRKDELLRNRRELVRVDEAIEIFNAVVSPLRDAFDLLPDALERQAKLTPEALVIVETVADNFRREIAAEIIRLQEKLIGNAAIADNVADQ